MIDKTDKDLDFIKPNKPIPTLEVDIDSIPDELYGYDSIVRRALEKFINICPKSRSTIYVFFGTSVNFHKHTSSAFIGVAGNDKKILDLMNTEFRKVQGIRIRFSDYINHTSGNCEFHVQDGLVWQPEDPYNWFSKTVVVPIVGQSDINDENDDSKIINERLSSPSRYRIARADASIGSIKEIIEEVFGLPKGSVSLSGPDGRPLRSDAKIKTLRNRWDEP